MYIPRGKGIFQAFASRYFTKGSEIWALITDKVGDSVVFAIPAKDLIVFVNANNANDVKGLKAMVEDVHQYGERLLSKLLYVYQNDRIEVLT